MIRFESQQAAVEQIFSQRMGAGTFLGKAELLSGCVDSSARPEGSASTDAPMRG
jgi:hypothetical protein